MREIYKNILITFIISLSSLVIGLVISFFIFLLMPGNPILNKIGFVLDPELYEEILIQIGYYKPPFVRFANYLIMFFSGNWGYSYIAQPGIGVIQLIFKVLPRSIELVIIPIVIGFLLANIYRRNKRNWKGRTLYIFSIIGIAIPIFYLSSLLQHAFMNILPVVFIMDPSYPTIAYVTGFPLFDAVITGEWSAALDIILHYIIPTITLSIFSIAFFTRHYQSNLLSDTRKPSIFSNTIKTGILFGFMVIYVMVLEVQFNRRGFGYYMIQALFAGDFLVVNGILFMFVIIFTVAIFISNMMFILFKTDALRNTKLVKWFSNSNHDDQQAEKKDMEITSKHECRTFFMERLKSPFTIIGIIILLALIFIARFPQLFTPYPLEQIIPPFIPSEGIPFADPTPVHPLGTTKYGYDLLARIIWGIQEALIFGLGVLAIGIVGGAVVGIGFVFLGTINERVKIVLYNTNLAILSLFLVIPGIFITIIFNAILVLNVFMLSLGFLLIPIFTQILINITIKKINIYDIITKIIRYILLTLGISILINASTGFLFLVDGNSVNLGLTLAYSMTHFITLLPWLMPGLTIFIIILCFILLHEGFKPKQETPVLR